MNEQGHHHMDPDIEKLIHLLKKILKRDPQGSDQIAKLFDGKGVNVNLCFMTFIPMTFDEVDELNEYYDDMLNRQDDASRREYDPELEFKLTTGDVEFLKKNGIHF